MRFLVVNADDFGKATGINEGIVQAHRHGIVTSASLMVRGPAATDAASYAKRAVAFSVGLHLDLGEWAFQAGGWVERYRVTDVADRRAVIEEVADQLDRFQDLVARAPSHLDSHQHVHRHEPVRSVLLEVAARLGVPLRGHSGVRYQGEFYGQGGRGEPYPAGITVDALLAIAQRLDEGWTELGCHPGAGPVDDVYGAEREQELHTLCHPRVRAGLGGLGVGLRTFDDAVAALNRRP